MYFIKNQYAFHLTQYTESQIFQAIFLCTKLTILQTKNYFNTYHRLDITVWVLFYYTVLLFCFTIVNLIFQA